MRRYVFQRLNTAVFKDPGAVSHNIARVTSHVRTKLQASGADDLGRRVLQLVPTREGEQALQTPQGEHWRVFHFVEKTFSRLSVNDSAEAYAAARAFGEFSAMLGDLDPDGLQETIPAFHDTPARFRRLREALATDAAGRAASASAEIALAFQLQDLAPALGELAKRESLPLRVTHNDTKISNVLFDECSREAVCIVDLDTVMPGLVLYDAGELVRTACTRAAEDEPDPDRVVVEPELLSAVVRGFSEGAGPVVSRAEREAFVLAGRVLAFENGIRFLTDYLSGDAYFRVSRSTHNLDRARAQLTLAARLEKYET